MILCGKGVAVMQSHSHESYFILPAKKLPIARLPRSPLAKGALLLVVMVAMAIVALSLGLWWEVS